jgi:hypothetical protein
MVIAAAGGNSSEELMTFASNLTIDSEEYEQFNKGKVAITNTKSKLPVHASTQDEAAQANFDKAADKNNFDMLALFGQGMMTGKPGQ